MSYLWEDDDGELWESPHSDDWARGRCSGIPDCCIAYFVAYSSKKSCGTAYPGEPGDWGYRPCPDCARRGRKVEVRSCGQLKDACTCGTWAGRRRL